MRKEKDHTVYVTEEAGEKERLLRSSAKKVEQDIKKYGWEGLKVINHAREVIGCNRLKLMDKEQIMAYTGLLNEGKDAMIDDVKELGDLIVKVKEVVSRIENKTALKRAESELLVLTIEELEKAEMALEGAKVNLQELRTGSEGEDVQGV